MFLIILLILSGIIVAFLKGHWVVAQAAEGFPNTFWVMSFTRQVFQLSFGVIKKSLSKYFRTSNFFSGIFSVVLQTYKKF